METSKDYIAGLAAGVSTVLVGHPFDTVKVRGRFSARGGVVARVFVYVQCVMYVVGGESLSKEYEKHVPCLITGQSVRPILI